ncbi:MAG: PDZ domain-containing protein [Phycisphaerales bacterium]
MRRLTLLEILALAAALLAGSPPAAADEISILNERIVEAFGRRDYATAERLIVEILARDPGDPEHLYNLACARSLQGDGAGACARLVEAIDAGFRDRTFAEEDPDLAAARSHPDFARVRELLDRVGEGGGHLAAERSLKGWLDRFGASRYRVETDPGRSLVIATSLGEESHREMLEMLDAQADHLVAALFERYPATPVLLVVARPEDATAFFSDESVAGLYEHQRRRLVTRDIGESLRHEFTHLLHHAQMERLKQRHPIWIQEGLASLYEAHEIAGDGSIRFLPNSRHNVAYRAARAGVTRPWRELVAMSPKAFMEESTRLYPQTRAMFEFIAAEAGLPRFWAAYLRTYPESPDGSAALREIFGDDLDAIEKRWKRWIVDRGPIDDSVRAGDASLGVEGEDRPDGVRVARVLPRSAASLAGIRRGDLLVALDGSAIRSTRELLLAIAAKRVGETVAVRVRRGDRTLDLHATLQALAGVGGTAIAPRPRR